MNTETATISLSSAQREQEPHGVETARHSRTLGGQVVSLTLSHLSADDLAIQRQAAQRLLSLRAEYGLAYQPVLIYRVGDILTITAADSLRAEQVEAGAIVEVVGAPRPNTTDKSAPTSSTAIVGC